MTDSLLRTEELEIQKTNTMAKYTRLPTEDFNRDVTAVAMDERFVLVIEVTNCQVRVLDLRELRELGMMANMHISERLSGFNGRMTDNLLLLLRLKTQKLAEITFFWDTL